MPFWWLIAALVASATTIVASQFFPDLIALLPWHNEALSERRNYIVFWLVLCLAGVLVQAMWWILRRTKGTVV